MGRIDLFDHKPAIELDANDEQGFRRAFEIRSVEFIGLAPSKFDADLRLTDETTRKFLTDLLVGFKAWIIRMQRK